MIHPEFFLIVGAATLASCYWLYKNPEEKKNTMLLLLFLGSLVLRWGFHAYFPQLQLWDEQFHALVAKNLTANPLHPKLYAEHAYTFDYRIWVSNETWLHKQPWFLWQIALFIKLFGTEVWAVRLPSLLMASVFPMVVFSIAHKLLSYKTAIISGVLSASAFYLSWWVGGYRPTDHNDVAFLFYVTLGCWAVFNYITKKQPLKYAVLVAVFVGIAVLNKWLVGLFPFLIWGLWLLFEPTVRSSKKHWFHLILASLIAVALFMPWQWYIFTSFPKEALFESNYNQRHFFEVLENHDNPWHFHFSNLSKTLLLPGRKYGWLLLLPAIIYGLKKLAFKDSLWKAWTFATLFLFLFFTVAATKMPGFTFIAAPFFFILIAVFLKDFFNAMSFLKYAKWLKKYGFFVVTFAIIYGYAIPFFGEINIRTIASNPFFEGRISNYEKMREIDAYLPEGNEKWVIFNSIKYEDLILMFHSQKNITAYSRIPDGNDIHIAHEKGYRIAVIQQENQELPQYVLENNRIIKLPLVIQQHDFY